MLRKGDSGAKTGPIATQKRTSPATHTRSRVGRDTPRIWPYQGSFGVGWLHYGAFSLNWPFG